MLTVTAGQAERTRRLPGGLPFFCRSDDRDAVRTKCLEIMTETVLANRHMYEPDLMEKVVVPFMKSLDGEPSVNVRVRGVSALTELLCECSSRNCMALLDVLERVVTKPLERNSASPLQGRYSVQSRDVGHRRENSKHIGFDGSEAG